MCSQSSFSGTLYAHDISSAAPVDDTFMASIFRLTHAKYGRHHRAMMLACSRKSGTVLTDGPFGRILPNTQSTRPV